MPNLIPVNERPSSPVFASGPDTAAVRPGVFRRDATVAGTCALVCAVLLALGRRDYPDLHTALDTAMFVLSSIVAWLLWDMGTRIRSLFKLQLAIAFAITSVTELIHVLVSVEWSGAFASIAAAETFLRPATWPAGAHVLPIGIAWATVLMRRGRTLMTGFALGLIALSAGLLRLFSAVPRYTPPVWLGITRPTLIVVPLLWVAVGWICWRNRDTNRVLPAMVPMAVVLVAAHISMLYSRGPHDAEAMVAHVGRVGAYLMLLLSLMRMASSDMLERIRAEHELALLNHGLEQRIQDRTAQLESANRSLLNEVGVRQMAEAKLQGQLARLHLLQHITRAIGERQDLRSIFQVVVRTVEEDLPVDFSCICTYDQISQSLEVLGVGLNSEALAIEVAITEHTQLPVDQNGLARCVRGELIYEPDILTSQLPFPARLAQLGLRSLVLAPLRVESKVFGVLICARLIAEGFSSGECEFLRQLGEHTALATQHAELFSALEQAYDDLRRTQQAVMQQERLRALGQMASGIAHDINNATSPVMLYTDLLEREANLRPQAKNYLKTIRHAVSDIKHTVARLTEFYREREPQLSLSRVLLNPLVQQVVDLTRARWSDMPLQRGVVIRMVTELAVDTSAVMGVESEIREALINLVFNAADALPGGGTITLRTKTGVLESPGLATLHEHHVEVSDTGAGMDEETRRRCLEPFFTTKGERGTGLGLAMVYGIAKRHGARLEIESGRGHGTTVRLAFAVPARQIADASGGPHDQPTPAPLRILVIDDDPLILRALRDVLEADGHSVSTANGGQQGIDMFRSQPERESFAIVFTDLGMPNVGGREVATALKRISPDTPVVLLTGWGQRLMAESERPPHVDCVLSKPPTLEQLRAALTQLTSKSSE